MTELFVLKAKLGLDLTFFNEGQATVVRRPNIFQEKNMTHHDEIRPLSKSLDLIYKPFKKVNCDLFNLLYFLSKKIYYYQIRLKEYFFSIMKG